MTQTPDICLAFDWFRNINGDRSILRRNVDWTFYFLQTTGLFNCDLSDLHGFLEDAGSALQKSGLIDNHHAWAHIYEDLAPWPDLENFFLSTVPGPVVIGFELSKGQKHLLERAGKTYFDLRTHPVRFLPDYMFAVSTNSPAFHERLCALTPPKSYVERHVSFAKARASRRYAQRIDPASSLVFFGQTAVDASRIGNGEITSDLFVLSELQKLIATYQPKDFFIKRHPHEALSPELADALKDLKAREIDTNTYDLLSIDGLLCASLSSSVCHEAQYFDAKPHVFLKPMETLAPIGTVPDPGAYMMAPSNVYSSEFWQFVLNDGPMPAPVFPEFQTPYKSASGLSWG